LKISIFHDSVFGTDANKIAPDKLDSFRTKPAITRCHWLWFRAELACPVL